MIEKMKKFETRMHPGYNLDAQLITPKQLLDIAETRVKISKPKLRAAIYCRCCSREENDSNSLQQQLKEARACVKRMGWILKDEYAECGSGNTVKGRTEYSRLLADMERQEFDIIVARSRDRLTIKVKHWFQLIDRMEAKGIKLYLYRDQEFFTSEDP